MMTNRVFYRGKQVAKRIYYYGRRYQCVLCGARTRVRHTISFNLPVLRDRDVVGGWPLEGPGGVDLLPEHRMRLHLHAGVGKHLRDLGRRLEEIEE